jgi:hypothetical protein
MKIFGIGLGRTGTTSLSAALRLLGYTCVHYPHDDAAIAGHDAAVDETVACQFKRLAGMFPGAKFVYTTRAMQDWLDSYERCFSNIPKGTSVHPVISRTYMKIYGQTTFERSVWENARRKHEDSVEKHFREALFLTINITEGEGWDPLCSFLNRSIPKETFPWMNRGQSSPS